jgi:hypothetical protein
MLTGLRPDKSYKFSAMKIDPNQPINYRQESVLCENGQVFLYDGSSTPLAELGHDESAFRKFCQSLDPNKCFIAALIPNDADRDVFFRAREVARSESLHLQATIDTPKRHRQMWENYKLVKQAASDQNKETGENHVRN